MHTLIHTLKIEHFIDKAEFSESKQNKISSLLEKGEYEIRL
jgi:hypothetical protein